MGALRAFLLALPLPLVGAGAAVSSPEPEVALPQREVEIAVRPVTEAALPVEGELTLVPAEDRWQERRLRLGDDGRARTMLPVGSTWRVCPRLASRWGRCELVTVEAGEEAQALLPLRVWPVGRLVGELKPADAADPLPERLAVSVRSPEREDASGAIPESVIFCERAESAAFSCEVPAQRLDVTLQAEGYVPLDFRGVEPAAGGAHSLGVVRIQRGASLAGRVEVEGGAVTPGECIARLSPFVAPGPGRLEADRGARVVASAEVRVDGAFRVGGVPPGTYVLEVEQPGFAPVRAFPIELARESETKLTEAVVLRRPLTVEVEIVPPLDWLEKRWTVRLTRQSDFSSGFDRVPPIARTAGPDGRLVVPDQSPGTFAVQVLDSQGNSMYGSLNVPIRDPGDLPVKIEVGLVILEGEVTLGDEPLPARLWFGGRRGEVSVEMQSDLEGRFSGVLPKDGWWRLEVAADEPPLELATRVEVLAEDGAAELRLELPDTEVFGRVVHEDGSPAPGARIGLDVEGVGSGQVADGTGGFVFRGIPEGIATVGAHQRGQDERLSSDVVMVPVTESSAAGPVELRLRRSRRISGRVVSEGVPVPGAIVEVRTLEPVSAAFSDSGRADQKGEVSLRVHPDATLLTATVSPPGHALTTRAVPVADPLVLEAPRRGGTLELVRDVEQNPEEGQPPPSLLVLQDGNPLGWQELWSWSRGHSVVWVKESPSIQIPNLAPGSYRFCSGSPAEAARAGAAGGDWKSGLARCVDGYLEAGGTLRLDLSAR